MEKCFLNKVSEVEIKVNIDVFDHIHTQKLFNAKKIEAMLEGK